MPASERDTKGRGKPKSAPLDLRDLPTVRGSGDDAERHDELLGEAHRFDERDEEE